MRDGCLGVGLQILLGTGEPEGVRASDGGPRAQLSSLVRPGPAFPSGRPRQRPLEVGRGVGAGEWAPGASTRSQGPPPLLCSLLRIPQRFPIASQIAIKFPQIRVYCCPLKTPSVSPFNLAHTNCLSRQMSSGPPRVLGSRLLCASPARGSFLRGRTPLWS